MRDQYAGVCVRVCACVCLTVLYVCVGWEELQGGSRTVLTDAAT